ncbi:hypothetical protein [Microbacterium sp. Leaf436]|uniref:hypothetical protein n=1 Tax=Microbacterium sp. Leaf436 TaxID=1736377 RepID=UPI0006FB5BB6|nr:hypothetical protein [Microbacterium sp. Leaf436]KQT75408.1 hypothetical protein ASG45_02595 [Microbacterium sp. Leaf436]
MTEWSLTVNDSITGTFRSHVQPAESDWSTSLAGDGTSTEKFVMGDADEPWTEEQIDETFEGNSRLLVRWWGDTPIYAQKIEENDIDYDTMKVKVSASDLIREADWRMIDGVLADKDSTLTITGRSAAGAVRAVFERMTQWGPDWQYPLDLPPDGAGDVGGTWRFWEKFRISDILKQIEDRTGCETFLQVYSPGGRDIRFRVVVGTPIVYGRTVFRLKADESPLSGVKRRKSWRRQVTGILGVGNGTGHDQETRWAGSPAGPIRDTKESFPDLTGDALQAAVTRYYEANSGPVTQWTVGSFTISDDNPPMLALPGNGWVLETPTVHSLRVIKVSGGNGLELKTEVQNAAS